MDEFIALYYATRILLGKAQIRLQCEDLVQAHREKLVASILEQEGPLSEQEIYHKITERIANELRTEDRTTLDLLTGLDHKIDPLLKAMRGEGKR